MIINEPVTQYVRKEIESVLIENSEKVSSYSKEFYSKNCDPSVESFVLIGLNIRNYVIFTKVITIGTDNACLISIKQIMKECILFNATSFICVHNHPSGDPSPSTADNRITRQVREGAQVMGITFFDHVIIGEKENDPLGLGYYSFRDTGEI